jgi:hypothetical protein
MDSGQSTVDVQFVIGDAGISQHIKITVYGHGITVDVIISTKSSDAVHCMFRLDYLSDGKNSEK